MGGSDSDSQRTPIPPNVAAQDELFEFLFSNAEIKYAELKDKAARQEPLPIFSLKGVKLTFNLDADYQVVRTQFTRNVIGTIEGSDAKLKDTYVLFSAHYDHVGYAEGEVFNGNRQGAVGRVKPGNVEDRIWNGADDDGSGTVTVLGIAKAYAIGPKPKRSLMFLWFAGEERGLWGSRYNADYPTVPIENIVADLNMDMVGRNSNDKAEEANSVFLVGSDRISTELHNICIDANAALAKPLKLDFEMNDPTDLEQIYYRSDHYSYAAKGIPITFFTTGLHGDYHYNSDQVEFINFEKMARIGQLVYEAGRRVANLDHAPVRDNKGPRVGKGSSGKIAP
ncbi:MAG: M28 family peptidase [Blastocatellales bacterium]